MTSDVAERSRSEKRVDYRMDKRVGIGVSDQAWSARDQHTSEKEWTRSVEFMRIISVTDTHVSQEFKVGSLE